MKSKKGERNEYRMKERKRENTLKSHTKMRRTKTLPTG